MCEPFPSKSFTLPHPSPLVILTSLSVILYTPQAVPPLALVRESPDLLIRSFIEVSTYCDEFSQFRFSFFLREQLHGDFLLKATVVSQSTPLTVPFTL